MLPSAHRAPSLSRAFPKIRGWGSLYFENISLNALWACAIIQTTVQGVIGGTARRLTAPCSKWLLHPPIMQLVP